MNTLQNPLKFALITPSYKPDFERCKLLIESVEHCLKDDTKHYVIVDRRDFQLFKSLTSAKVQLLFVEELLPPWIFRIPGIQKFWMSLQTFPIRNWILQQLVKISVCDAIDANVFVFCDSDNTFIRPFEMKPCLVEKTGLALKRVNFQNQNVYQWTECSKKILGIAEKQIPTISYVSNMISWRRDNILAMRHHIENIHGQHWIRAICQYRNISEYMIYGIFVEHVLGMKTANHFPFDTELIKPSWSDPLNSKVKVKNFFDQLQPSHIGVMIHSKHNIPIEMYRDRIKKFWQ